VGRWMDHGAVAAHGTNTVGWNRPDPTLAALIASLVLSYFRHRGSAHVEIFTVPE
jgi:hypothetical protein